MPQTPTAAILIIGNEILSGKTQDANTRFIAKRLSQAGIVLRETRTVRDDKDAIIKALDALRHDNTYVFTTGGIGPTHDDITADCVAEAFGVALPVHDEVRARMEAYYTAQGGGMNEARLRMARIPEGGTPIYNAGSIAPGIKIGNVYVLAGVPNIMQSMFDAIEPELMHGAEILSRAVRCSMREGDIAAPLEAIQKKYPDIEIGSYPHMQEKPYSLTLALRGTDAALLGAATADVMAMLSALGDAPLLGEEDAA